VTVIVEVLQRRIPGCTAPPQSPGQQPRPGTVRILAKIFRTFRVDVTRDRRKATTGNAEAFRHLRDACLLADVGDVPSSFRPYVDKARMETGGRKGSAWLSPRLAQASVRQSWPSPKVP